MADDDMGCPGVAQHLGRDVPGMRAAGRRMAILAPDQEAGALNRLRDRGEQKRRGADQDLAIGPASLLHALGHGCCQRKAIG